MNDLKTARRAIDKARREVAKALEAQGFRVAVWRKADKNRTIVQVFGKDLEALKVASKAEVARVNAKYAARFEYESPDYTNPSVMAVHRFAVKALYFMPNPREGFETCIGLQ